jgi:hypothetical protein
MNTKGRTGAKSAAIASIMCGGIRPRGVCCRHASVVKRAEAFTWSANGDKEDRRLGSPFGLSVYFMRVYLLARNGDALMGFTDEEIAKLKLVLKGNRSVGPKVVQALLERLEAAELVCESADCHLNTHDDSQVVPYRMDLAAWRKAAGK